MRLPRTLKKTLTNVYVGRWPRRGGRAHRRFRRFCRLAARTVEGQFSGWRPHPQPCNRLVAISGLPCGHPVEIRNSLGTYTDYQFRCIGGGHIWWMDGIDSQ